MVNIASRNKVKVLNTDLDSVVSNVEEWINSHEGSSYKIVENKGNNNSLFCASSYPVMYKGETNGNSWDVNMKITYSEKTGVVYFEQETINNSPKPKVKNPSINTMLVENHDVLTPCGYRFTDDCYSGKEVLDMIADQKRITPLVFFSEKSDLRGGDYDAIKEELYGLCLVVFGEDIGGGASYVNPNVALDYNGVKLPFNGFGKVFGGKYLPTQNKDRCFEEAPMDRENGAYFNAKKIMKEIRF